VSVREFIDIIVEDDVEVEGFLDDGNERLRHPPTGPEQSGGHATRPSSKPAWRPPADPLREGI